MVPPGSPNTMSLRPVALAAWLLGVVVLIPWQLAWNADLRVSAPGPGTPSAEVERRLRRDFDSPFATSAVLVIAGLDAPRDTDRWRAAVRTITDPVVARPAVTAIVSAGTSLDTLLVAHDFSLALAVVGLSDRYPDALDSLRAATARALPQLRRTMPRLTLEWTGEAPLLADLSRSGAHQTRVAELRALPLTALVAWWAFGSLTAALLASVVAVIAIAATFGVLGVAIPWIAPALPVRMLVPLVGLALTVDYCLYLVRRSDLPPPVRVRTIAIAALVVVIGFAALAIAPAGDLRAAAPGGIVVVILAAAAALTLVRTRPAPPRHDATGRWRQWGERVTQRPWTALLLGVAPLTALSAAAMHAHLATPLRNWLPPQLESARALDRLDRVGRANAAGTLHLLLTTPARVLDTTGWEALRRADSSLRTVPDVGAVRSLATIGTGALVVAQHVLPDAVRRTYVSRDGRTALIEVIPASTDGDTLAALVHRIRGMNAADMTALAGATMLVGGLPAYIVDYAQAVRTALPWIVVATAVATLLVLLAAFRAPVIAAKAVLLNLLVAAAAVGVTVLIFQEGVATALVGGHAFGAVFPTVPALAFGAAFGMSMDYELFLLVAVRDAHLQGRANRDAVVAGVAASGALIVRAAVLMAVVFAAFISSSLLPLQMVGTTLAAAVLLDASLVRLVLAPAILTLAGRWNWWPGPAVRQERRAGTGGVSHRTVGSG